MPRQLVTEAVMVAIYGQLLAPSAPVEYLVPYTTVLELYELQSSPEPLMELAEEDQHVKKKIGELITYFEEPFNKKKISKALQTPWAKSSSILLDDKVSISIIGAMDTAQYGDFFDPIETELLLTAQRFNLPLLTDQAEWIGRIIEASVPVQVYDIEDFEYALENDDFSTDPT
ncbi:ADP-heptose synthase [Neobacillus mesonae]|nr:ADP-heptose synthase [Neobacillus mesonae]